MSLCLPAPPAAVDPPRAVTVAVTSDRGLCGGLNSNITKYTKALLAMYKGGEPQQQPQQPQPQQQQQQLLKPPSQCRLV